MSSLHTAETTGRIEEPGRHNNSRYDELREILEKHRLGLTKEFESGKQRDQDEVGQAGGVRDLGEIAEGASQAYVRAEMLDMKSVGIANVDRALDSLKSGTYGYCLECREEIPS
jgi:RNA polymerase-binding transcription factor DksA